MLIRIRVRRVDMDGYCGRDLHPDRSDEGACGTVEKFETITDEFFGGPEPDSFAVLTVRLDDGRLLEFIDHEVDVIASSVLL
jgi:hypothetical protein